MLRIIVVAAMFLALIAPVGHAETQPQRRVALVIGNGTYEHLPRLANPVPDAELMADALKSVGFELIGGKAQTDLDHAGFERAVREFAAALADGGVGLFYYAGHGVQAQGANYLVPVGANPATAADIDFQLVDANTVLKAMAAGRSGLNIVILDACRNNPFGTSKLRDIGHGLAIMQAPRGTVISYATQPGNVALDGDAGHSPYTTALAETIRKPGLPLFQVFNEVALSVDRATSGNQQPWMAASPLEGNFVFVTKTAPASKYDGEWRGTFSCGPHKYRSLGSFSWQDIAFEIKGGRIAGKWRYHTPPENVEAEAIFTGQVERNGAINVTVAAKRTDKRDDFYSSLLRKSVKPSEIQLAGPMLISEGRTARDCQLTLKAAASEQH
jgi:hypothetical protein